jgi:hypothetical protein
MNAPTVNDLRSAGYRMSANAAADIVSRCAETAKRDYLMHYVTEEDISDAAATSAIGRVWCALTFVAYLQQVEFGTRTGGERKRFDYGEHLACMSAAKADAATALRALSKTYSRITPVVDSLEIYFKSQILR